MRGKDIKLTFDAGELRITPAYAGKRQRLCRVRPAQGDHPRVCGEKDDKNAANVARVGSPPRMRGKVKV